MPRIGALIRSRLREWRGQLRYWMGLCLQRLFGPRHTLTRLDPAQLRSILVVRINGRLGNTLFLTPMLEQLHRLLPQAQIDVAVSYPNAPQLLAGLPGLRGVILFPHKGRGILGQYLRALRQLRARRYDLAIDPTPFSTSGRLILALTHARFRLGFSVRSQWAPLTHAIALPAETLHQGRVAPYLIAGALGAIWQPATVRLWLPLSAAELSAARACLAAVLPDFGRRPTVGFFARATGLKALQPQWWQAFWRALLAQRPQLVPVEFLPATDAAATVTGIAALHLSSQRQLTATVAALQLFISADAGPMHLASATDTPTLGLFQATDPLLYGPLKPVDHSIQVAGRSAEEVAAQVAAICATLGC